MPSRTSVAPRRRPGRLAFFFRFPQYKIQRIFFLIFSGYQKGTVSGTQIIEIFMGKFAIFFKTACAEIYGTVYVVSIPFLDKRGDHVDHTVNFLCCQRMCGGRFDIHACHILFALCNVTLGNLFCCHAFFVCLCNDLVVNIGKVGYIIYFITFMLQVTSDGIKHDHRSCISDVDQIVYGRAAYIHADFAFLKRHKFFFLFG